jgi:hypothetical protein
MLMMNLYILELKDYVKTIAPEKEDIVKLYQGKVSFLKA